MKPFLVLCFLLGACASDDPVDVAGNYTVNITLGPNGCNAQNWEVGSSASNLHIVLDQDTGSPAFTATVMDLLGVEIYLLFNTNVFTGRVSGADIDAVLTSLYDPQMQANCTYKYQLHMTGTLDGDTLTGKLDVTTATNHSPDCGGLENCHSTIDFNGLRPPTTH